MGGGKTNWINERGARHHVPPLDFREPREERGEKREERRAEGGRKEGRKAKGRGRPISPLRSVDGALLIHLSHANRVSTLPRSLA